MTLSGPTGRRQRSASPHRPPRAATMRPRPQASSHSLRHAQPADPAQLGNKPGSASAPDGEASQPQPLSQQGSQRQDAGEGASSAQHAGSAETGALVAEQQQERSSLGGPALQAEQPTQQQACGAFEQAHCQPSEPLAQVSGPGSSRIGPTLC